MNENHKVLIVVTLYKTLPRDAVTVVCLADAWRQNADLEGAYDLLLWDNSPVALASAASIDIPCRYQHATTNDGVSGAYNGALQICIKNGYEWMLLLDQDTVVTADFLRGMIQHRQLIAQNGADDADVAAIVPVLRDNDFQLSPKQVLRYRDTPVVRAESGRLSGEVFAANSGVMMRVSALQSIGGYSLDFWLDHSDMYVFLELHRRRQRVYLAADLVLQHSMTMLDYDRQMTPGRYENFLQAEQAFFDRYKAPDQNAVQVLRVLMRVMRQWRRYQNKTYARMTWRFFLHRITSRKTERLRAFAQRRVQRRRSQPVGGA